MTLDLIRVVIELGGIGVFLLYTLWHLENDPAAPQSETSTECVTNTTSIESLTYPDKDNFS